MPLGKFIELIQAQQIPFPQRVVVRLNGLDYDIANITTSYDGVLGDYIIINTCKLDV